jgi:hypothetical protein
MPRNVRRGRYGAEALILMCRRRGRGLLFGLRLSHRLGTWRRVQRVDRPDVTKIRSWRAHERVAVRRG